MTSQKTIIEFHILQSFPITCLNRDDVGSPKSALIGGVPRARVSSQCWKRQVRRSLQDLGVKLGQRSKDVATLFSKACLIEGATEEQANLVGKHMADQLADDTLLFISQAEAQAFASLAKSVNFETAKLTAKELAKVAKNTLQKGTDALDIALFGRMVAKAPEMNVEAASSFSHAISTHKVVPEIDFFTAVDDLAEEPGAGHMGTTEFTSAVYYRYVCLDLAQLGAQMSPEDLRLAVKAFIHALFLAVPAARQKTYAGFGSWDFARVYVRSGQPVQASFEKPVKSSGDGFLDPSIDRLRSELDERERRFGSLFRKKWSCEFGANEANIDELVEGVLSQLEVEG